MTWNKIKQEIISDLLSKKRNLSQPKRRISAFYRIESILQSNFPEFIRAPIIFFNNHKKEKVKQIITKIEGNKKINSAESSIINEIYYRIK